MSVELVHSSSTDRLLLVPSIAAFLREENPWFGDIAEKLRLLDPDMDTAVVEFDQMHKGYDYKRLFPLVITHDASMI